MKSIRLTSKTLVRIIAIAVINALLLAGTTIGVQYYASGATNGTASVGFQGYQGYQGNQGFNWWRISHIYFFIRRIYFHGCGNTSDSWYGSGSWKPFDLVSLANVTRMFGDSYVSPGTYSSITLYVSSVVATINSHNETLQVPGGQIQVPLQFQIVRGQPTSLVLTVSTNNQMIFQNHFLNVNVTGQVSGPY